MMRIQNPSMAGQALRLRFTGERVELDAEGAADVPEKDGRFLCETPGWSEVKAKGSRQPVAAPSSPPPPPPAPPTPELEAPAEAPPAAAVAPTEPPPAPAEEEGPDIEALRTKKAALAVAEDYGVDLDPEAKLSEMKTRLDAEIYGDD